MRDWLRRFRTPNGTLEQTENFENVVVIRGQVHPVTQSSPENSTSNSGEPSRVTDPYGIYDHEAEFRHQRDGAINPQPQKSSEEEQ